MEEITEKLPAEFKAEWIKALRSGKYKQGRGYLKIDGSYCCLGVSCIVAGIDPEIIEGSENPESPYHNGYELISNLPERVQNNVPFILRDNNEESDIINTLTKMNDGVGNCPQRSFNEIADYIEKNL